jgi:geranylgeranyl pyrophosphate synthase
MLETRRPIPPSPRRPPARLTYADARRRHAPALERRVLEGGCAAGFLGRMVGDHLAGGGKRLRALLPVWLCGNLGGDPEAALDLGAGIELLHNATLVHDDLQDGDEYRRGRPAVWARWGAAQAINAGDALIFQGLACIARAEAGPRLGAAVAQALLRTAEGQTMDLQMRRPAGDPAALAPTLTAWEAAARRKSGALIGLALRAGAAAAGRPDGEQERAARYGEDLGLLFQLQDDYLDLVGDKGRERRGCDLREGKRSFPVAWTLERGDRAVVRTLRAFLDRPRAERRWELVDEVLEALRAAGALQAARLHLRGLELELSRHPLAESLPGLCEAFLAPIAHALESVPGAG